MSALRHVKQIEALNDRSRFSYWLAGRRGGKTTGFREYLLEAIPTAPKGAEIYYIGPTNQHAMELMWEPLEERINELGWKYRPRISRQRFEFSNGRKIYIIGGEKIQRVRGKKILRFVIDELAYFRTPIETIWRALRPALSDLKGDGRVGTTPDGKGTEAYEFWMECLKAQDWSTHQWVSIDNPFFPKDEIEKARNDLDEISFNQEYMATWETFGSVAYYSFDENLHIKKQPAIDDKAPVILSFDFNVNPTTLLIAQKDRLKDRNLLRFKKEYSQRHSSTESTVTTFCEDFKDKAKVWDVRIRGDASGDNRSSNTGKSDYFYIEELLKKYGFKYKREVWSANPPIVDRVKHANSWLKNANGQHRVEIDPSCKDLIKDLSTQQLDGRIPSDKNNLGHKADAFGYCIFWEHKNEQAPKHRAGMI